MKHRIAYIGCLGMLGIITTEFGIIGILPQIALHYNITIERAGILLSAFALVIALTGPLMTLSTSGIDRKKIMFTTIAIFLITAAVSAMSPPFWLLLLVRILPAFLQPVYISTAIAAAVNSGNKEQETQLMGIVLGGIALAMVTTVPLATYLAGLLSWQMSFVVQGLVSALALLAITRLPAMPVLKRKTFGSQLQILKQPLFLISTAMNFFMIAAWFSTYSYFAAYLEKVKQMDVTMISYMLFLFGLTGVLANWISGKMLSKSIPLTTAFFVFGTLIIPFLLQFAGVNLWVNILVIAIWGFLYAPCFLNASAYMISAAPQALEFANSLATSFGNLGVSAGTIFSGWIISRYSMTMAPWTGFVFGCLCLLMICWRSWLEKNSPTYKAD